MNRADLKYVYIYVNSWFWDLFGGGVKTDSPYTYVSPVVCPPHFR
jgi:hypothetical protein